MKKLMHILFLSCLKASELIEKKFHFGLTFSEKIQLKMHKMMCDACTQYEKQSVILEKGIVAMQKNNASQADIEGLKKLITEKLSHNEK